MRGEGWVGVCVSESNWLRERERESEKEEEEEER